VRFVVDTVVLGQVFPEYLGFPWWTQFELHGPLCEFKEIYLRKYMRPSYGLELKFPKSLLLKIKTFSKDYYF
jgi:hypothetical protein